MAKNNYQKLIKLTKKHKTLSSIASLLSWDTKVMMPPAAIELRVKQEGTLAEVIHELSTKEEIGDLIAAIKPEQLNEDERANFEEIKYGYELSRKVPSELVKELAEVGTCSCRAWEDAKKKSDYSIFQPWLGKIISLQKSYAHAINPAKDPYTVLMGDYEDGLERDEISTYLQSIKEGVMPIIQAISKKKNPSKQILRKNISEATQEAFCRQVAEKIGYDFSKGRLDKSAHPFTSCYGRITTRYNVSWLESISSTMHEAGHGMFDHDLPFEHFGTPLGEQPGSQSMHESQSRFWENHIGKSKEFWQLMIPNLNKAYGLNMTPEKMYRLINIVEPDFIRTRADELTYVMHIILRYELESEMISGNLDLKNLPDIWNKKMKDYLGITPRNAAEGVLQDIHWSYGAIGYFPTYTIGSMISAQLFERIDQEMPIKEYITNGEFRPIHRWLKENIHKHGRRYKTKEIVERATGSKPRPEPYINYLTKKYTELYNL